MTDLSDDLVAGALRPGRRPRPQTPAEEARMAAHIKKVVDGCPPLTEDQVDRLRVLLWQHR